MRNLVGIATFLSLTMVSGYLSADDSVEAVGQKIYASYCSVCHDSGLAGAPRVVTMICGPPWIICFDR